MMFLFLLVDFDPEEWKGLNASLLGDFSWNILIISSIL